MQPNNLPKHGQLAPVTPNIIGPNVGLNDDFLLDGTLETPEPTIHVKAFQDSAPGELPTEDPNTDLIAAAECECSKLQAETYAALEELEVNLRDLELLRHRIRDEKGMSASIALECNDVMPGFINEENRPVQFFTQHGTKTLLKEALEAIEEGENKAKGNFTDKIKALIERFMAFAKNVWERISKMFKRKSASERMQEHLQEVKKRKAAGGQSAGAVMSQALDALERMTQSELASFVTQNLTNRNLSGKFHAAAAAHSAANGFDLFKENTAALAQLGSLSEADVIERDAEIISMLNEAASKFDAMLQETKDAERSEVASYVAAVRSTPKYTTTVHDSFMAFMKVESAMVKTIGAHEPSLDEGSVDSSLVHMKNTAAIFSAASNLINKMQAISNAVNVVDTAIWDAYRGICKSVSDEYVGKMPEGTDQETWRLFREVFAGGSSFNAAE